MNYILLPTLRHAATVRTSALLYNDQELKNMIFPPPKDLEDPEWPLIEQEILEKLPTLLPVTVKESVAKFFRYMYGEVERWEWDHKYILTHVGSSFFDFLVWKTDGTINRLETAKKLVINDTIDDDIRFITACTYFLEDEILDLWQSIKKTDEHAVGNISEENYAERITLKGTNEAVRFWIELLTIGIARHWRLMVDGYFRFPFDGQFDACLRVSSFFDFLSLEKKKFYIRFVSYSDCHTDDFPRCLIKMDESERFELFKDKIVHALCVCMWWPFRSRFLEMAKEGINCILEWQFEDVMDFLLRSFWKGHKDFYLLETFYEMTPAALKEELKNSDRFIWLSKDVLKRKGYSKSLKDIIRKWNLGTDNKARDG